MDDEMTSSESDPRGFVGDRKDQSDVEGQSIRYPITTGEDSDVQGHVQPRRPAGGGEQVLRETLPDSDENR